MLEFLKSNAVIFITWLVTLGVGYGVYSQQMKWIDQRVTQIEAVNVQQIRWQVDQNGRDIDQIKIENKNATQAISDIKAQVGVINTKLDTLIDEVRKVPKR